MIENVELESLEGLERKLKVEVSALEVGSAYDKRLTTVASTIELKGFRKGKVPKSVVEGKYAQALRQEVANDLIQVALPKAIDEQKVKLVGQPQIDAEPLEKDKNFVFTALFEVYPDVEVKDLAGIAVEKNVSSIEAADIDDTMQQIRQQQAEWKVVERASQDGDRLKVDFEGFINDVAFDGGKAENFELILGSKKMVPGFEDGLLNQAADGATDLKVTFPDDYQPKDLAAKDVVFKVKVHEVAEPLLPELNDELAKKMGVEEGFEALQTKVKDNLQRELDTRLRNKFKSVLLDSLLLQNDLEVPKTLVESEIKHMRQMQNQQLAAMQGQNAVPDIDIPDEHFKDEALKRVKLGLLLSEVIQKNEIKLDQDKVTARIEEMASAYPQKEQIISYYRNNKQMLAQVEAAVMEDQALEILADSANIKEVSLSYKEVMNEK
jgi:trigger factor